MRAAIIILLLLMGITILLLGVFGPRTSYDYGYLCTKCRMSRHVVESRVAGVTYWTKSTPGHPGFDYQRIFGQPCRHVFRKGGCGWQDDEGGITCGFTVEGSFFSPRNHAVNMCYDLESRMGNMALALETFHLIDALLPPEADWKDSKRMSSGDHETTKMLGAYLQAVNTVDQWKQVLECAKGGFATKPDFAPR